MILEHFYVFSYLGGMDLKDIHIQKIENLMEYEFSHLVQDSEEEGLNEDPYTKDNKIGRLRRFYISRDYRRIGLGNLLLNQLLCHAEKYFEVIVLHADTKQGDVFYTANGFVKGGLYTGSSHYKLL
ncbi:GNAT family N-acetyltransferase [Bacillus cereus]|uniref:GNAT family N-acetyltransferase n=1 Tax=Bacillus cereus TaxID=1396 RepID=UPI0018F361A5|nr:GNAT family N-acetyltransferase [Bacillus cereus]MBJ8025802.1 GNAT family N-acetyltransferase [Bacillus cereus]MBJ8038169.1 GNAT family N-acetyltransferase [Bacillus cereus]